MRVNKELEAKWKSLLHYLKLRDNFIASGLITASEGAELLATIQSYEIDRLFEKLNFERVKTLVSQIESHQTKLKLLGNELADLWYSDNSYYRVKSDRNDPSYTLKGRVEAALRIRC